MELASGLKEVHAFAMAKQNMLGRLWARWQDEKEYEDIKQYGEAIAREFPAGWKLTGTNKRPFGVKVNVGNDYYSITITGKSIKTKKL